MTRTPAQIRAVTAAYERLKVAGAARKTFVIQPDAVKKLAKLAAKRGKSATQVVNELIMKEPL